MTINFQQVNNNNPFVVGQIGGSYNTGVSVGDIKELYELLGYSESEDIGSQLLSSAGFSVVGAAPEIIKSIKYSDDIKAAYEFAQRTGNNKMEQFILSNKFEDLLIDDTKNKMKVLNKDNGLWEKFKQLFSKANLGDLDFDEKSVHKTLKVSVDEQTATTPRTIKIMDLKDPKSSATATAAVSPAPVPAPVTPATTPANITKKNLQTVNNKLDDLNLKGVKVKNIESSFAKEAFSGWGLAITAITGLTTELPSIITAFKESSSEGWTQLGKSVATIGISDVLCSAGGQVLGGTLGFAIGGLLGPVGASIGGAIGKTIGASVGSILGRQLSSWIFGKSTTEQQQEEQIEEQAKEVASSQINLQSFLAQAKQQAAAETDSNKAQQINAKIQAIENKLNPLSITSSNQTSTSTNPFVNV